MGRLAAALLVGLLAGAGCGPQRATRPTPSPPPPPRQLTAADPLPTGPAATARPGDWLIVAGPVRFVVGDLGHREGFQASGGNLLDVSLSGLDDQLDGISTWFEREFPRQGSYQEIAVQGQALVVRGVDSVSPSVQVETRWEPVAPPPGVIASLRITTTVTSEGALPEFDLGDIVGWGGLRHFAPGPGFALKGTSGPLPWVGAEGPDHAVLLVGAGPLTGPHGASWSDPVWAAPDLAAGVPHSYVRTLHVGPTLAGLLGATEPARAARIQARETGTNRPIPGARFTIEQAGRPYAVGRVDAVGALDVALPSGPVTVALAERGRRAGPAVVIAPDDALAVVTASPLGRVLARIEGPAGTPIAGRLTFTSDEGPVDLGPLSHAIGGDRVNLAAPTTFSIPPGLYRVSASHGPLWSLSESDLVVPEGQTTLTMALRPLVDATGVVQCDLHQHAAYSADSAIPPVDGVIASSAEGLDCIATTEHDAVADWTEHIAAAQLPDPMVWLSGIEVTSNKDGHYNVYPWDPALGTIAHDGLDPFAITAAIRQRAPTAILQVNHPRYGAIGAYNRLGTADRIAALDHDAIEVLNGKSTDEASRILDDVARLLGSGVVSALVGASDSHHLVGQERGSARTYVFTDSDTVAGVTAAIQARECTASNGPLLRLTATDGQLDLRLAAPAWMGALTVSLYEGQAGSAALGEPIAQWSPVSGDDSVLGAWTHPATAGRWYLAVASGPLPMEPWLDAPPWAVTSPVVIP